MTIDIKSAVLRQIVGGDFELSLTIPKEFKAAAINACESVKDGWCVEVKKKTKPRSQDANAYCWVLCQKIAEVIKSTKEDVYRRFVRDVGQFVIVPIRDDAHEEYIRKWSAKGIGWCAEIAGESKLQGYKNIITYFGSSVYNTQEMSVLINEIVSEAKELGIDTATPAELQRMESEWGKKEK